MWKNKVLQRIGATKHQNFKYKHEHRKHLLPMVRNLVTSYIQGFSKDSFHKYQATVDVEVGNFKKIRFFPVKIEVIQRIVNHPTIHASRNAFLSGG